MQSGSAKIKSEKDTKLKLNKSLIKSILLHNCGTWSITKYQEDQLNSFHRRQLRKILGIKYPTIITNQKLYEKCKEIPLSITILKARWKIFGHILRRDMNIPANQTMTYYIDRNKSDKNFRGKERTTLPSTLSNVLDKLQKYENHDHAYCSQLSLRNQEDLEKLRTTAQNRVG